jgi:hypothetical protein
MLSKSTDWSQYTLFASYNGYALHDIGSMSQVFWGEAWRIAATNLMEVISSTRHIRNSDPFPSPLLLPHLLILFPSFPFAFPLLPPPTILLAVEAYALEPSATGPSHTQTAHLFRRRMNLGRSRHVLKQVHNKGNLLYAQIWYLHGVAIQSAGFCVLTPQTSEIARRFGDWTLSPSSSGTYSVGPNRQS